MKYIRNILKAPKAIDALILSLLTILVTWHPFYMHGTLNFFELGLYAPGIQSLLNGEVPYRDFHVYRGPMELYVPVWMMNIFGNHLTVLYSYFYIGSICCFILLILIAKELFKTRYFLYLLVPVLIGRTFPRVVFIYWGGFRFAYGLLALLFLIKFFKTQKKIWIYLGGIATAIGFLTSPEIGVFPTAGIIVALSAGALFKVFPLRVAMRSFFTFLLGSASIMVPYCFILFFHLRPLVPLPLVLPPFF